MPTVNLDALIPREDFALVPEEGVPLGPLQASLKLSELEPQNLFYSVLRKPDFQRETTEWKPDRVCGLIKTFVEGDLIPAVILWRSNNRLNYVIDGSHRLSALIAWVHDDYGDGARSLAMFADSIKEDQKRIARKTRELVNAAVGSYQQLQQAGLNPRSQPPNILTRAREIAVRSLAVQWIEGTTVKAEESFIRINQQAAAIGPQELALIKNRKLPNAISARAVLRRAAGHQYWSAFGADQQQRIKALATETHDLIFDPPTDYPIKVNDPSVGGSASAGAALGMVYDFVNLCGTPPGSQDTDGSLTIDQLTRAQKAMRLIASNHESSLGLHPIIYFYSWTGRHQPIQFLTVADFALRLDREGRLFEFCELRGRFEDYLVAHRPILQGVIRAHGSVLSRRKEIVRYFFDVLDFIKAGRAAGEIVPALISTGRYSYLSSQPPTFEGTQGAPFTRGVKSGAKMRILLQGVARCAICQGYLPTRCISWDHAQDRAQGGTNAADNAQATHPYCNTAYKSYLASRNSMGG